MFVKPADCRFFKGFWWDSLQTRLRPTQFDYRAYPQIIKCPTWMGFKKSQNYNPTFTAYRLKNSLTKFIPPRRDLAKFIIEHQSHQKLRLKFHSNSALNILRRKRTSSGFCSPIIQSFFQALRLSALFTNMAKAWSQSKLLVQVLFWRPHQNYWLFHCPRCVGFSSLSVP